MTSPDPTSASLIEDLADELRRQAQDDINRTEWEGAAAAAYQNALALVVSAAPRIRRAAFYEGARRAALADRRTNDIP